MYVVDDKICLLQENPVSSCMHVLLEFVEVKFIVSSNARLPNWVATSKLQLVIRIFTSFGHCSDQERERHSIYRSRMYSYLIRQLRNSMIWSLQVKARCRYNYSEFVPFIRKKASIFLRVNILSICIYLFCQVSPR
jgi:hypothetical protein